MICCCLKEERVAIFCLRFIVIADSQYFYKIFVVFISPPCWQISEELARSEQKKTKIDNISVCMHYILVQMDSCSHDKEKKEKRTDVK